MKQMEETVNIHPCLSFLHAKDCDTQSHTSKVQTDFFSWTASIHGLIVGTEKCSFERLLRMFEQK